MLKRLILTSILYIGIFGCCGEYLEHWYIEEASLDFYGTSSQDTIYVVGELIDFEIKFSPGFVQTTNNPFEVRGGLWAFQCQDNGEKGCNDPIVELYLFSDSNFNGIAPSDDLKSKVSFFDGSDDYNLEDYISQMDSISYSFSDLSGTFLERPEDTIQTFTLEVLTESNHLFSAKSKVIVWQ